VSYAEKIKSENFQRTDKEKITITNEGLSKIDKQIASSLKKNVNARLGNISAAAGFPAKK
jgi:hypothetical protein